MRRALLTTTLALGLAGVPACSPNAPTDGFYGCATGSCPSQFPYCDPVELRCYAEVPIDEDARAHARRGVDVRYHAVRQRQRSGIVVIEVLDGGARAGNPIERRAIGGGRHVEHGHAVPASRVHAVEQGDGLLALAADGVGLVEDVGVLMRRSPAMLGARRRLLRSRAVVAAWRAVFQLVRQPYRWEKTTHGLARTSRRTRT